MVQCPSQFGCKQPCAQSWTYIHSSEWQQCDRSFSSFPPASLAILQAAMPFVLSTGHSQSCALSCPLVFLSLVVGRTRTGQMRRVPGKLLLG